MITPTILDQHGQPIRTRDLREPQSAATTRYLSTEMDGHPSSGLTPRRIFAILQASEQGDLVQLQDLADDILERDGQIFSTLGQRAAGVTSMDVNILPPKGATPAEKEQAARVQGLLDDAGIDLRALASDLLDAILKGYAALEQWWEPEGKLVVPRHEVRAQRCFQVRGTWAQQQPAGPSTYGTMLDARNELRLRTPGTTDGEALRPYNWIIHRHRAKSGYLAKQSLARVLIWPYVLKHYALRDLAEFLEIHGLPLRLGTYPAGASDADKRVLLRAVSEIGHNAAGIIPSGMMIDFKEAAKGDGASFMSMVDYQDSIIAKVVLGQTLTSGEGKHGTQALGQVHEGVRKDIQDADADSVAATLTRDLLWPFVQFNLPGVDYARMPRVHIGCEEYQDIKALADSLPTLVKMGARISVNWLHEETGIPLAAEGENILQGDTAPQASAANALTPTSPAKPGAAALAAALQARRPVPPADDIDHLVAQALGEWQPTMGPLVRPILEEIDALEEGDAQGLQSLMERLPELLLRMDATQLGALLTRTGVVAHLAGSAGSANGNEAAA